MTELHFPFRKIRFKAQTSQICFVSFGGSPLDLSFAEDANSILHMYLCGQAVGRACANLIAGISNPCGKLAETFPKKLTDIPCHSYFGKETDDIEYRESIFVGYRYYDSYHIPVSYCFGHGLSYTTFSYSDASITYNGLNIDVSFFITNTGGVAGAEIVQLYIENPECKYLRAKKELKGFTKVSLLPGRTKQVHLSLTKESFQIYDEQKRRFLTPAGEYIIHLASSLEDIRLSLPIKIDGEAYMRDDAVRLSDYFQKQEHGMNISRQQFSLLYNQPLSDFDHTKKGEYNNCHSLKQLSHSSFLGKIFLFISRKIVYKMMKGKAHDDPEVLMMIKGIEDGTIDSVICQSEGLVPYKVCDAIVLSANGKHLQALKALLAPPAKRSSS